MIKINRIDHIVLTVKDIQATCDFYERILNMKVVTFNSDRKALVFGNQKINLHQQGNEIEPKANSATVGSADMCLVTDTNLNEVYEFLKSRDVEILFDRIVERTGALGKIYSVYLRDPDLNLIELSNYAED